MNSTGQLGRVCGAEVTPGNAPARQSLIRSTIGVAAFGGLLLGLLLALPTRATAQATMSEESLTIGEAARLALEGHPATVRAGERLAAARADERIARAPVFPTLALTGSTVRFQEPMVVAPLHAFDPARPPMFDETLLQGAIQATYTLFDGGARGANTARANAGVVGAQAASRGTGADVLASLVRTYVGVQAARAGLGAAAAQLEALTAERERSERVFQEGAAPRVQVLRASAAWQEAQAAVAGAEARLEATERDLARLTGLPWTDVADTPLPPNTVGPLASNGPTGAMDIGRAPRMEMARQQLEAARASENVARAALFPRVEGMLGFQEFGSGAGNFVGEWQAGVQVSYPVFAGGARMAGTERARANTRGAEADVDVLELELRRALDQAIARRTEAAGRRDALVAAVEQYEEVARIEALSLAEGAGLQRDLLTAQAELFRARSMLAEVEAALTTSSVEIARIQGDLDLDWIHQNLESTS